jgi:hypothetical protein
MNRTNKLNPNWKGFIAESKSYMGYPDGGSGRFAEWNHADVVEGGWTIRERNIAKLVFWIAFPVAWVKFYWLTFRDWIRSKIRRVVILTRRLNE